MSLPGPNQTQTNERRRRVLPSEILFSHRPAQLRNLTQALAAGMVVDQPSREAGRADGTARRRWDPGDHDIFSYACGYVAGLQYGHHSKGG